MPPFSHFFTVCWLSPSLSHTPPYCTLSGWQVQVCHTSKPRSLPQAIQSSPAESIHSWKIRTCLRLSRLKEQKLKVQTSAIYCAQQLWIYSMGLNACYKTSENWPSYCSESGLLLLSHLTERYSCVWRLRKTDSPIFTMADLKKLQHNTDYQRFISVIQWQSSFHPGNVSQIEMCNMADLVPKIPASATTGFSQGFPGIHSAQRLSLLVAHL